MIWWKSIYMDFVDFLYVDPCTAKIRSLQAPRWSVCWLVLDRADSKKIVPERLGNRRNKCAERGIYKRLIAACNPIVLLAQVWHQKNIWGCLSAGDGYRRTESKSMNNRHFKHFRNPIVSKMFIVQMNEYAFFFSADIQPTDNIQSSLSVQNGLKSG